MYPDSTAADFNLFQAHFHLRLERKGFKNLFFNSGFYPMIKTQYQSACACYKSVLEWPESMELYFLNRLCGPAVLIRNRTFFKGNLYITVLWKVFLEFKQKNL